MSYVVEYGNDNGNGPIEETITSVAELDALLDRIDQQARDEHFPALVMISPSDDDGPVLSLGLGRPEFSFLTFDTDYVRGDLDDGKPAEWFINDEPSELPPGFNTAVPVAREAAREFVRTGQRPSNVAWTG